MNISELRIGMSVRHPQYGLGTVKSLSEISADIQFNDTRRPVEPESAQLQFAEPHAAVTGLNLPLVQLIENTIEAVSSKLGLDKPHDSAGRLGARWHRGKIVMHPADPTLQTKEVDIEVFFHKVVMVRDKLRVLEQKINAHPNLSDAEKVELQHYITGSYGSLTTFNVLFRDKDDHF
jgi:hypothetical protein